MTMIKHSMNTTTIIELIYFCCCLLPVTGYSFYLSTTKELIGTQNWEENPVLKTLLLYPSRLDDSDYNKYSRNFKVSFYREAPATKGIGRL